MTALTPSKALSQDGNDIEMARRHIAIANRSDNLDTIKLHSKKAYKTAMQVNDVPLLIDCVNNLAYVYGTERNYDSAIIYYKRLFLIVSDDTTRKKDMARTLGNLGICYKNTGKYLDMWNNFRQSKNLFEQLHDTAKICWTSNEMGQAYEHFGMYQQAREHYEKALELAIKYHSYDDVAISKFNIGNIIITEYFDVQSDQAATMAAQARDIIKESLHDSYYSAASDVDTMRVKADLALSKCYITLLKAHPDNADYADSCKIRLSRYIKAATNKSIPDSIATENMKAMLLTQDNKHRDAIKILENITRTSVSDDAGQKNIAEAYKLLSESYTTVGDVKNAYLAKKHYYELYNKLGNEENMKRTANFAAQTEIDVQREQQSNEKKLRDAAEKAEKARRKSLRETLLAGLILAAIIAFAIIMSLRKKRQLGKELNDRNNQLLMQRDIIERQKNDEQEAQSIILSSVEYASKIQSLAIGNYESVSAVFPESFVYYSPRNIVSGDWYMATKLKGHKIMIEADCTGHGIPGALLCMLGVSALKDILNQIRHTSSEILPGIILDEMRTSVKKALNKDNTDSKTIIDDGMDMSIVILPPEGGTMLFGSANQSAVLVSKGTATRLKGDANPIGNYVREKAHFTTSTLPVSHGDAVYLFSDGIQDQTGGDEERKYSLKKLTTFLADHYAMPMTQQLALFEIDIDTYAAGQPQVDDRTLVGIRI